MIVENITPWVLTCRGTSGGEAAADGEKITLAIRENEYECRVFEKKASGIKPLTFYSFSADIVSEDCEYRVTVCFKDSEGKEITKLYAKKNEEFYSPENANLADIAVTVWGECGSFELSGFFLEEKGEYKTKKAVVASIGLKYNRVVRNPGWNMAQTEAEIDRLCGERKVDLIVLTEHMYDRWTAFTDHLPIDSEPVNIMKRKACQYGTMIVFSMRLIRDGRKSNTALLIDRNGKIAGTYDKIHITMGERDKGLVPGKDFAVFDTDIGRIGFAICWDMFFPEHISALRKQGVDIICNPTAGYEERRTAERAYEAGAYIVTSGVEDLSYSAIFNPLGEKISDASENDGFAVAEIEIGRKYPTFWLSWPCDTYSGNIFENERRGDLY